MAAIRGYTKMILDKRAGPTADAQRDYLEVIQENTNRLIGLVNWMSDLFDSSTARLQLENVDLAQLWKDCRRSHHPAIQAKAIQVEELFPVDPVVIGDRERLATVFQVLLSTSLHYSSDHGRITVEFSRGRDREAIVRITDTSPGIPAEELSQLLDRGNAAGMFGLKMRDTRQPAFANAYDIVGLHGGRLFVNSRLGEGTTFLFTLPAVSRRSEERLADEQAFHSGRRRR
jgi:signal transduction histidine kinase